MINDQGLHNFIFYYLHYILWVIFKSSHLHWDYKKKNKGPLSIDSSKFPWDALALMDSSHHFLAITHDPRMNQLSSLKQTVPDTYIAF